MRKLFGVLFAAAILLPVGIVAAPAGATEVVSCQSGSGNATFSPSLPKLGSHNRVHDTLTAIGSLSNCAGGGVSGGTTKFVAPPTKTGSNCTTLTHYSSTPTTGVEFIKWDTGRSSIVSVELHSVKGHPTYRTVTGTFTAGLFKGSHQSGLLSFTLPAGACTSTGLAKATYQTISPSKIK